MINLFDRIPDAASKITETNPPSQVSLIANLLITGYDRSPGRL